MISNAFIGRTDEVINSVLIIRELKIQVYD